MWVWRGGRGLLKGPTWENMVASTTATPHPFPASSLPAGTALLPFGSLQKIPHYAVPGRGQCLLANFCCSILFGCWREKKSRTSRSDSKRYTGLLRTSPVCVCTMLMLPRWGRKHFAGDFSFFPLSAPLREYLHFFV